MNRVILSPEYFPNPTIGRPISNADIYVGIVDLDPEIVGNRLQISVQQENGTIVQVAQPVQTGAGGVPLYNGSPVTILVDGNYSLKVLDKLGSQIYYIPSQADFVDSFQNVDDMLGLVGVTGQEDGYVVDILGYFVTFPESSFAGGGRFVWQEDLDKNTANGGTIIDPDNIGGFDGTISTRDAFLTAQGGGVGLGCWVRNDVFDILPEYFGAVPGTDDNTAPIASSITLQKTGYTSVKFGAGVYLTDQIASSADDIVLTGNGTLKLNDAAASGHLFTMSGGSLTINGVGGLFELDGNKANQTIGVGLGPDLISSTSPVYLDGIQFTNGARYGLKTNTGASRSTIKNIYSSGVDNVSIFLENVNYSDIQNINCTDGGTLLHIRDASSHNTINGVNARITTADKFGVELFANDAGGGIPVSANPKYNVVSNVTVDGTNTSGGISISGASYNTLSNIAVKDVGSVASLEFAFGAEHNIVSTLIATNSKRVAITGQSTAIVKNNYLTDIRSINPISGDNGIFMEFANENTINSPNVEGASGNHSFQIKDSLNNKINNVNLKGTALSAFYIEGTSANNVVEGGNIESHDTASRYMFQFVGSAATALNVFKNISGNNNTALSSDFVGPVFENITQDKSYKNSGTLTLTAGTSTTVTQPNVSTASHITLTPTSANAAALASVYISSKGAGGDFIVTHSSAAGTETFDYLIK